MVRKNANQRVRQEINTYRLRKGHLKALEALQYGFFFNWWLGLGLGFGGVTGSAPLKPPGASAAGVSFNGLIIG